MRFQPLTTALRRRLAVWLLVLTTMFGALAPTLSQAVVLALGEDAPMLEFCSRTGMSWVVNTTATDAPDGQESTPSRKICPFCLLSTDRAAPPPHPLVHLFVVLGDYEASTVRQAFFFIIPFAPTPPSRGPPAFPFAI